MSKYKNSRGKIEWNIGTILRSLNEYKGKELETRLKLLQDDLLATLDKPEEDSYYRCKKCNEIVDVGQSYCNKCVKPTTKCSCCNSDCLDLEVNPCGEIEPIEWIDFRKDFTGEDIEYNFNLLRLKQCEIIKKLNQIK